MNEPPITRMLAVDIRSSRLGFAVFEMPVQLLDWGAKVISTDDSCSLAIERLSRRYSISLVVLRRIKAGGRRDLLDVRRKQRVVRTVARGRAIRVETISEAGFRTFFRRYERNTKFEVASLSALVFPELAWTLPRPRKCYEPEDRWITTFDAVALGIAFLASSMDNGPFQTLVASAAGVLSPASR